MKKEELLEIGLTEEQANRVFAMNGQDVEREKAKTTQAKADLADAQGKLTAAASELETLKKAGGDLSAVQKQFTDLQAKYDRDTGDLRTQLADRDYADAVSRAISGKALKFTSKSAERAFTAALREKKLALKDGELEGLDDFIQAQREADPDAFASEKPPARFVTGSGSGGHGAPPAQKSRAAEIAERFNQSLYGSQKKE